LPSDNFETSYGELAGALQPAVDPPAGNRIDNVTPTGDGECRQQAIEDRSEIPEREERYSEQEYAAEKEKARRIVSVRGVRADAAEQPEHAGDPKPNDDNVHDENEELVGAGLLRLAIQGR
jgi:hypothetical protein